MQKTRTRSWEHLAWCFLTVFVVVAVVGCARTTTSGAVEQPPTATPAEATSRKTPEPAPSKGPDVGPEVGNRAPDFSLPNGEGETVSLSSYFGKPIVIVFYRGYW